MNTAIAGIILIPCIVLVWRLIRVIKKNNALHEIMRLHSPILNGDNIGNSLDNHKLILEIIASRGITQIDLPLEINLVTLRERAVRSFEEHIEGREEELRKKRQELLQLKNGADDKYLLEIGLLALAFLRMQTRLENHRVQLVDFKNKAPG